MTTPPRPAATATGDASSERVRRLVVVACLLLAAIAFVYWRVPSFDFVNYDDPVYVSANPMVAAGFTAAGVRWAFTTLTESNWHPLTWLSLMLDATVGGRQPWIFHLVNVLLHAAASLCLFLALDRMTGRTGRSALVAALFAVHPLHVESVAWIAERKDVLSGLFWMLTLLAWARYVELPTQRRYGGALLLFALGLMAKPMVVSLPIVLLLLDVWPLGRLVPLRSGSRGTAPAERDRAKGHADHEAPHTSKHVCGGAPHRDACSHEAAARRSERASSSREADAGGPRGAQAPERGSASASQGSGGHGLGHLILEKIPFFGLSAVSAAVTLVAQARGGSFASTSIYPLPVRVANAVVAAASYLGDTFWPAKLAAFYPHPGSGLSAGRVFLSTTLLVAITVGAIVTSRSHGFVLTGWGWYLVSLVPVSGLVQVGLQARADRYTYIPLVGVFLMIAWGVPALLDWTLHRSASRVAERAAHPGADPGSGERAAREAHGAPAGSERTTSIVDSTGSGRHSSGSRLLGLVPPQSRSRALAGAAIVAVVALAVTARLQAGYWRDSITLFTHTLEITGPNGIAEESLGAALHAAGRADDALVHLRRAVEILPDYTDAHVNLGGALMNLGHTENAVREYRLAAKADPSAPALRAKLAAALERQGNLDDAIAEYREAARLAPTDPGPRGRLGHLLLLRDDRAGAIAALSEAAKLGPGDPRVEADLGLVYLAENRFAEAAVHLEEAVRLGSLGAAVRSNLGLALARLGRSEEARAHLAEAVRLDPHDVGARINLGLVLLGLDRFEEAESQFLEAERLAPDDADAKQLLALARKKSEARRSGAPLGPVATPAP